MKSLKMYIITKCTLGYIAIGDLSPLALNGTVIEII